ncbi:MAG: hypothetical protein C4575_12735 [Desulforudis sp.]|jgi:hypothetical protein|nr:MAG: hypothetical protein C4575_12735 [Desulforudis sp.]
MPSYDFRTLSPIDFEGLVRDLLQEEFALTLESFKAGKDLGIDFRYSTDKDETLVVQCKHYVESGFDALIHVLTSKELKKVHALKPSRYIVATSIPLSSAQKDSISNVLSPYVLNTGDVLGKEDLNNLLGKFPHVERQTIKLWLTSLPILEEVLHAGIYNMSREELSRIREHALLYVQNASFEEAARILDDHNFCIIAGIPGIGKTTLAEMLVLHYSRAGYEVVKVSEDMTEAWKLVKPETRRVFYYDDFLGQTSFGEKLNKNEDQRLIDFIHTVRKSSGVKLILTTREYILQQAYLQYEKLNREGFSTEKCIIDLAKYTRMNRAKILFNHVYFSALPAQYRKCLLEDKRYLKIIDHPNYSPRIVQLLTDYRRLRNVRPSGYVTLFLNSMNNPLAIWQHAFMNHLSQAARNLLLMMVSMPYEVLLADAEIAYQAYNLGYSRHFGSTIGPQDFRSALKELDGDFLVYQREGSNILIRYQNPSIRDFLRMYLSSSQSEMALLIETIVFYEQLKSLWSWSGEEAGRSGVRRFFEKDPSLATSIMRRTLSSPPCRLIHVSRAGATRREHWPISLEARLVLVAEIGTDCCSPLLALVQEKLPCIESRIRERGLDRDGLADLLEALSNHVEAGVEWARAFANAGYDALLIEPGLSDDLRPICRLVEKRSSMLPEGTLKRVEEALLSVADSIASGEWDLTADELREEAESLKSLAFDLGVDIESQLEAILVWADKLEEESGRDDRNLEFLSTSSGEEDIADDDEIASIFSTLNVTP